MKNIITLLITLVAFSSCSSITSLSVLNGGKLDVPKKDSYNVIYKANFSEGLTANISYTDAQGKSVDLRGVTGAWEKRVMANSGTKVKINTIASSSYKAKASFDVSVDGKSVSSYEFNGKRVNYGYTVELP
ncbi:hypothetical protein [Pedobacter rhodius]|uniref:Uncharacterized protein n=1 Tax=Pedobacter rhodius TaxID=3004098 RepID=A0ABT4L2T6_9SPHI|nr:hypothetical protein [Pedobacter sp. SJ11]MCZ4225503.1 hypothetical protein [Pedobacter sp. SJ11]